MALIRKVISLSLTGGAIGYRSAEEKQARRQKKLISAQTAAAQAQAALVAQQAQLAVERQRAELAALAQEQELVKAEFQQRWLAQQPVKCAHCRTVSEPGTRLCPQCGSKDVAYSASISSAPSAQSGNWKDKVTRRAKDRLNR